MNTFASVPFLIGSAFAWRRERIRPKECQPYPTGQPSLESLNPMDVRPSCHRERPIASVASNTSALITLPFHFSHHGALLYQGASPKTTKKEYIRSYPFSSSSASQCMGHRQSSRRSDLSGCQTCTCPSFRLRSWPGHKSHLLAWYPSATSSCYRKLQW